MGRDRKRFNVKARESGRGSKEDAPPPEAMEGVALAEGAFEGGKYDVANPLLLPPRAQKEKGLKGPERGVREKRLLTKKQRKRLQQIVDRREKKAGRAELLEELQKYQLSAETFQKLTPLVQVQTEGLKKLLAPLRGTEKEGIPIPAGVAEPPPRKRVKSSIKGANKYRSWSGRFGGVKGVDGKGADPKVLGFEEESESDEGDSEDEEVKPDVSVKEEVVSDQEEEDGDVEILDPKSQPQSETSSTPAADSQSTKPNGTGTKKRRVASSVMQKDSSEKIKKTFVPVSRTEEIEAVRNKLPIIPEEQVIMESITESLVTVLCGETGSGKTTQVPQFLYEAGYSLNGKLIGVTEPRRVAAISMSMRVAKELNLPQDVVSYQIRFDGNVSPKTQIKFMTDGVLLKEMERDFLLSKYSVICIDEAHERSLYTDLLIGLLSRCVLVRHKRGDPLKLVVMSATMRVQDFVENPILFKTPPRLIHVPTRQFPVQIHFSKVTPENYVVAAYKKAVQIHRKLPAGGILIFVTGQQEVKTLVKQLRRNFTSCNDEDQYMEDVEAEKFPTKKVRRRKGSETSSSIKLRNFDLDKLSSVPLRGNEDDEQDDEDGSYHGSEDEDLSGDELDDETSGPKEPLHVLPLYSMLPSHEQQRVFEAPPPGTRLCVVATNVAETSLTIPSVRYVVDCGKVKLKVWDKLTGVQQFQISWESKASAEQRAGRAGRTGPGHCYRLFSSAVFSDEFPAYSIPEIQVRPVDDMILLMKSMAIDRVQNFPYPSPPNKDQLIAAEDTLLALGALQPKPSGTGRPRTAGRNSDSVGDNTEITELGKSMSYFPLGPRFSKMLALSFNHSVVEYTIALVSALTVQEVFLDASLDGGSTKQVKSGWAVIRRKWAGSGPCFLLGDCLVLLRAVGAFEYSGGTEEFCFRSGLRYKAMMEIRKLRKQITSDLNLLIGAGEEVPLNPFMEPPSEEKALLLRQIILSGLPDRVGRKVLESELKEGQDPKVYRHAYKCSDMEDPVFLHTSSVFKGNQPDWIVYQEIFESNGKMYLRGVTAIEPDWIPTFCPTLCKLNSPLTDPPPYYDEQKGTVHCSVKATYGRQGWELPIVQVEHPHSLDKFKFFAQFLLEGKPYPAMQNWSNRLLSLPATMTKSWAKLQPRTQTLLTALTSNSVCSKDSLTAKWKADSVFLLKEYLQWLPEELHSEVKKCWPPITN